MVFRARCDILWQLAAAATNAGASYTLVPWLEYVLFLQKLASIPYITTYDMAKIMFFYPWKRDIKNKKPYTCNLQNSNWQKHSFHKGNSNIFLTLKLFLNAEFFETFCKKGDFSLFSSYMYLSAQRSSLSTTIEFLQQQQGAWRRQVGIGCHYNDVSDD